MTKRLEILALAGLFGAACWLALPMPMPALGFGIGATMIVAGLAHRHPFPHLGWANAVTLGRAWGAGGMLASASAPLALVLVALDGLDGWLARRRGNASPFGARFDMETDAALSLILSGLLVTEGRVGIWVLLTGLWRYLYVAAGLVWPRLAGDVPPSLARKIACVVQLLCLIAALAPTLPWPGLWAGLALAVTSWSFGRDILWLLRR